MANAFEECTPSAEIENDADGALENNSSEFLGKSEVVKEIVLAECLGSLELSEKVTDKLKEAVARGSFEEHGELLAFSNLSVKAETAEEAINFFRLAVEDFSGIDLDLLENDELKEYYRALKEASAGNFDKFREQILNSLGRRGGESEASSPEITAENGKMSYKIASENVAVSVDVKEKIAKFEKLDGKKEDDSGSYGFDAAFFSHVVGAIKRKIQKESGERLIGEDDWNDPEWSKHEENIMRKRDEWRKGDDTEEGGE